MRMARSIGLYCPPPIPRMNAYSIRCHHPGVTAHSGAVKVRFGEARIGEEIESRLRLFRVGGEAYP